MAALFNFNTEVKYMIELLNVLPQEVDVGASVLFTSVAVRSGKCERHRDGSGILTLTTPGRYLIGFSGNIAVPEGETVGEVSLGIALDGEVLPGSTMRATPAAVEEYFNVATTHYVDVYCNCCVSISVQNNGDIPILVDNPNLTAVRVA